MSSSRVLTRKTRGQVPFSEGTWYSHDLSLLVPLTLIPSWDHDCDVPTQSISIFPTSHAVFFGGRSPWWPLLKSRDVSSAWGWLSHTNGNSFAWGDLSTLLHLFLITSLVNRIDLRVFVLHFGIWSNITLFIFAQIVPASAIGSSFRWLWQLFDIFPSFWFVFEHFTFWLNEMPQVHLLYTSCPSPSISHVSKEPWFLYWELSEESFQHNDCFIYMPSVLSFIMKSF